MREPDHSSDFPHRIIRAQRLHYLCAWTLRVSTYVQRRHAFWFEVLWGRHSMEGTPPLAAICTGDLLGSDSQEGLLQMRGALWAPEHSDCMLEAVAICHDACTCPCTRQGRSSVGLLWLVGRVIMHHSTPKGTALEG